MNTTIKQQMSAVKSRYNELQSLISGLYQKDTVHPLNARTVKILRKMEKEALALNDAYSTLASINLQPK